ncbi:26S proteasome non-ATPase regulatory subunit 12-like [Daphnia carinata]|uniref:26S proteasome non-ATPase regulatory subunit 12-like n=1 Tax=Daphnia carinata TaxID=120202 RepID=UPI002579635B|nr:26S proteasome non-ATPase regulatory subunit 12-like [Daphnia carinata]
MAESNTTDGGRIVKMEVDYSSTCDDKIPICKALAAEGKINEALEILYALEKQTRTGADAISTGRILEAIVQICFESKQWDLLNENIISLTKRRSQLKASVTKMVQQCCQYVDQTPTKEIKIKLIDTLRTVTAGKIYVEVERARLTHILAQMKEKDGEVTEAADILQELQVETYGSMEKREKVELILEQMRLCLAKKDFIRTQIISKKISVKFFEEKDTHDLKLKFYKLMIDVDQHEGSYLSICKHYRAMYNTTVIQENESDRRMMMQHAILYLLLSPFDNEQSDLTHRFLQEKVVDEIPKYKELLQLFVAAELIHWGTLCQQYQQVLRAGEASTPATDVFTIGTEEGEKRWKALKTRVVEYNIRIMAKYYTRVTMQRMAALLDLSVEETEEFLSNLVSSKTVTAKVDRLDGVVHFQTSQTQDVNAVLNSWSSGLASLMDLVTKTNHLINREEMVHRHLLATNPSQE